MYLLRRASRRSCATPRLSDYDYHSCYFRLGKLECQLNGIHVVVELMRGRTLKLELPPHAFMQNLPSMKLSYLCDFCSPRSQRVLKPKRWVFIWEEHLSFPDGRIISKGGLAVRRAEVVLQLGMQIYGQPIRFELRSASGVWCS